MNSLLIVGIILAVGCLFGEIVSRFHLPRVTGYILAGVFLNPEFLGLIPARFSEHTDLVTNFSLAFITFSVGGTLRWSKIRRLGATILAITVCEAEGALLFVAVGLGAFLHLTGDAFGPGLAAMAFPVSLLVASLAAPTDPSATLAVAHESGARGDVSSTILGTAAFDDILGILNYSLCVALVKLDMLHAGVSLEASLLHPALAIAGGVGLGVAFGLAFNAVTSFVVKESGRTLIVVIFAFLALCFGLGRMLGLDELLATMAMGGVVVNANPRQDEIFSRLQEHTEELVFVLFFVLSAMHLKFDVLARVHWLILVYVLLRAAGKFTGTFAGATLARAPSRVRRYTPLGLIPQGGIVIGLALLIRNTPAFASFSDTIIAIVIGATVIHEIIGPVVALMALKGAGEVSQPPSS